MDDKATLQSNPRLQVTLDTLNKAYHGQWWDHLKRLTTKCPCNVALGNVGQFPAGIQFLRYIPAALSLSLSPLTR